MNYLALFRMPTPMKITGRSSSITNAFINSIIPVIPPTEDQVKEALSILEMTPETIACSYCGASASEWDHLRPLVLNKKPTGYISEIHNLVPACGKCNQSKGNKPWRQWMFSDATLSPKTKGVSDIEERAKRLDAYENWCPPTQLDFEAIVGNEVWAIHQHNLEQVQQLMRQSQELAEEIKRTVGLAHAKR
jgi:hypothetical protein